MAVWETRLVYKVADRFWENIFHVDIGSATDVPPDLVLAFEQFGRSVLLDAFTLDRIVRRPAGSHDAFIETVVGLVGLNTVGTSKILPLFNVVRVLLQVGAGRPGIKYLRGLLLNVHLIDEQDHIDPALLTIVNNAFDTLYNAASDAACTFVVGADDKPSVSAAVDHTIEMRQQHRKRKKTA